MRLNTLTFDANLPTTQQVNVPTNTDYKVGMKVKRNGEVQQLGPQEFTIYTGEINVIPPTDYTSTTKTCEDASSMNLLSLKEADLSALAGQKIKYTDVYVEFSFDNGTTWSKLVPEVNSVMVQVIDRAGGTNNYIARLDLRNQNQKWVVLDHNVPTGEVADYVIIPDAARMSIQFLGSDWGSLTYPCLWRFIFLYGGQEIPVTIPTDADKTNGYVTFTQAAGDDASFRQLKVAVEHGYDSADSIKTTGQFPSTTPTPNPSQVLLTAADLGIAGKVIKASDYANIEYWMYSGTTPAPDDLSAWSIHKDSIFTYPDRDWAQQMMAPAGTTKPMFITKLNEDIGPFPDDYPEPSLRGKSMEVGKWYFADAELSSGQYIWRRISETKVFEPDETVIYLSGARFTSNYYWGRLTKFAFGTPFTADFKLNVNEFKSQCGDIDAGGPGTDIDVNSVKAKSVSVVDDAGELVAALSSDGEGNGLLVLDNIAFTGAELSATFAANQILEGLV